MTTSPNRLLDNIYSLFDAMRAAPKNLDGRPIYMKEAEDFGRKTHETLCAALTNYKTCSVGKQVAETMIASLFWETLMAQHKTKESSLLAGIKMGLNSAISRLEYLTSLPHGTLLTVNGEKGLLEAVKSLSAEEILKGCSNG